MNHSPKSYGIVLPLWTWTEAPELLERAHGEIGLDHVTVPVVTGPVRTFRISGAATSPYFESEGGWQFPPEGKVYAGAGVRPPRARWLGTGDPLGRLRAELERLGVGLTVRLDLRRVRAVVEDQPQFAQQNAWGQAVPAAGMCVSHPHLRELLRATCEDLRRYSPVLIQVVDWLVDHAAGEPPAAPPALLPFVAACFCPACRQIGERAGLEPESAARALRSFVAAHAQDPTTAALEDPVLGPYTAAREADAAQWLARLADADRERRYAHFVAGPARRPEDEPVAPAAPTGFNVCMGAASERAPGRLEQVTRWPVPPVASTHLVRAVADAARQGVWHFDFEGLDTSPVEVVTWVKQAVRFARRG